MKKITLTVIMLISQCFIQASDVCQANQFAPGVLAENMVTLASIVIVCDALTCHRIVSSSNTCPRVDLQQEAKRFKFQYWQDLTSSSLATSFQKTNAKSQQKEHEFQKWQFQTNRSLVTVPRYKKIQQPSSKKLIRRG